MSKLQDRVALVTGAGRGIGRSIALAYAAEGANVAVSARSADELDDVVGHIESQGGGAAAFTADLADAAAPAKLVEQVNQRFGPIEVLVNNAGIGSSASPNPVVTFDDNHWDRTLAINLTAPYLLCKLVLADMLKAGRGRIIMIASINSKVGSLHGAAYAASKHGLLGLVRTIALEEAGHGVTINAICPGPVRTQMNNHRIQYDADRLGITLDQIEQQSTPIGRRLEPDEIAPMAVYLAEDAAACITGQAFNIDGGLVMY